MHADIDYGIFDDTSWVFFNNLQFLMNITLQLSLCEHFLEF